jgi:hypothetical protein
MPLDPQAQQLNDAIAATHPQVLDMLSRRGKAIYFPKLGVLMQSAEAQSKEKTFFHLIKELTLLGYFTAEPVGKNVLHYDPIPGRYQGCIPISEVGNVSWTR